MDDIGPVEYLIVSFPGNQFKGEILPELANLVESGTIRIIDLAFVGKDTSGNTLMFELSDLDPDIQREFGAIGASPAACSTRKTYGPPPRSSTTTRRPRCSCGRTSGRPSSPAAIRNAGGEVLDLERIPRDVVVAAREYARAQSAS